MRAIFISYRREDSEGQAGRIYDDLTRAFGESAVFMDVAAIEPGRDFRRAIDQHVASCGVLLAVIGKNWLGAKSESGQRRLDDAMDFVRLETASALKRDIPVVPVLVQGATMPRVEELPEDLRELAYRAGFQLTHVHWDSDIQILVKALRPYLQAMQAAEAPIDPVVSAAPPAVPTAPNRRPALRTAVAVLVGIVLVAAVALVWRLNSAKANGVAATVPEATPALGPTAAAAEVQSATAEVQTVQVQVTPVERPPGRPGDTSPGSEPPARPASFELEPASAVRVDEPEPAAEPARSRLVPVPSAIAEYNLVGRWKNNDGAYQFTKDDGRYIEAVCVAGCVTDLRLSGGYISAKRARIDFASTWKGHESCGVVRQLGTLTVRSVDEIEISTEKWQRAGCELVLNASTAKLYRAP